MNTATRQGWHKSMLAGSYVSDDGRFTATLRPAGFYPEFGCKLTRHYIVAEHGHVIGTARTLADAAQMYLY